MLETIKTKHLVMEVVTGILCVEDDGGNWAYFTQETASELLPHLAAFAETGSLEVKNGSDV